jgi:hypothetical protein
MCLNETCSTVRIGKNMSEKFPIQNGLKQEDALSPLLCNFALEYAFGMVKENQEGLKLNEIFQLFAHANDVNLVRENTDAVNKNSKALLNICKEVGVEVNP